MIRKLLATCAAASLISLPALAQTLPAETAPPADAEALPPPPPHISEITVAPPASPVDLAPGARVLDPAGDELGQVVSVTQPKPQEHLQAFCILQRQGVTVALPVSSLRLADGALTARETRAEVWGTR